MYKPLKLSKCGEEMGEVPSGLQGVGFYGVGDDPGG